MKLILRAHMIITMFFSSFTMATTLCEGGEAFSDVNLTTMQLASGGPVVDLSLIPPPNALYSNDGRAATSCEGILSGNDQPLPSVNIGQYQDGLLNGEKQKGGNADPLLSPNNQLFDPQYNGGSDLAFIELSDLQNISGVGGIESDGVNDPGWVFLGKDDGGVGGFDYATAGNGLENDEGEDISIDISTILDVEFNCTGNTSINGSNCLVGTWSIMPDVNIVEELFPLFGNGFFDHLAFIFKAGPEFIVYDFNFNIIKNELGGGIDLTVPYNMSGTFDMTDTFGKTAISHISVWARDPIFEDIRRIPEPKTYWLMLLAGWLIYNRIRHSPSKYL
ncbi:hypothetical protein [Colwellia sp. RSH04]|uniref:hypothetical protein n=1 Tax=Colwellia sp. RSH04 TaxID=2305464 RepID=UPI000E568EC8|nr:hypothetical protein [Colwellia sp. RSH04]RHW74711.1 hypothetical protein D1094_17375 [Colwellia sp. RSH04]